MKAILATAAIVLSFATLAQAQQVYPPGGCAGQLLGTCVERQNGEDVGPNYVMCIARDSANAKYTYTGSYGRPTSENVQGAINNCRAHSHKPASCHWTACVWAD